MPDTFTPADPILIVGAGPTGTTLAIELLRRGVPCRVIDRRSGPVTTSRSFTLHARTLELFELAGFVDRFLERGIESVSMDYRFEGDHPMAKLDFTELDSRFAYTLIINQDVTEQVLRDRLAELGGTVEWDTELRAAVDEGEGGVSATLAYAGGREETVRAGWLIGCDGLHSVVRGQLGLEFEGDEYTGMEMRMMDVPLDGFPLGDTSIHYLIGTDRMILVTKLPGANYRVLISDMGAARDTGTARENFQRALDDHFHGEVTLGDPEWSTVFTIWRRISSGYRRGRILVCGDAAHIHSPAGGQGMNACIQDAVNLGWKLALIVRGGACESLLETYERERRPIAEQVSEGTHLLHAVIMAHGKSIRERLAIAREPGFNRQAVRQISGLSYTYRDVVSIPPGLQPMPGPAAGDRAPDVPITPRLRLYDLLRHHYYTVLVFQCEPHSRAEELTQTLADRFGDRVRVRVIASQGLGVFACPGAVIAEDTAAHDLYGALEGDTICLVRPDGYLALRCRSAEHEAVTTLLDSVLV